MHSIGHHSQASQSCSTASAQNDTHTGCCGAAKATHDAIAKRAYDIYRKTGSKPGHCKQNWQQAETELQTAGQVV